ncbi:DEAD/DEAH box helicase [Corynebacterium glucuronolyticum]|uniref:DEAD/DEAH box helicase n=1 Tax=Corynebacterium glucuronolyticum TaxID=39791 RepID=UPI00019C1AB4|nr:DEAD/DEAH box helicase [Corynebacterium glucuronolyticum]EEI28219.1 putative DEAH-box helicase [Corynebacterium glucuronolyticum ATCC 51867]QRO81848.1 DEAD/DEAH box helicase [Corynebacterium glucuronolyticum]
MRFGEEIAAQLTNALGKEHVEHLRITPTRAATFAPYPAWVDPGLREFLTERGITSLFSHQADAATAAHDGENVVISTGTSSGKSLAYLLPILTRMAKQEGATALYLTPTKALATDQIRNVNAIIRGAGISGVNPNAYDGDTPQEVRRAVREMSRFIFTNPDMLHQAILPDHARWSRFLRRLAFVVIDECHSYRGVFGAHMSQVMWRFQRLLAHYGATPVFIAASATAADPGAHAARLLGVPVRAITRDGAPRGERTTILWTPGEETSATTEAAHIMSVLLSEGLRTLTFVRSRRAAETVAMQCGEELLRSGRTEEAKRVAAYRAGYLAEDRRRLERQLDTGEIIGLATTNALELGIDVGGLDAVITTGFPGTIASFTQQAGRAGRRGQGALSVFVARDEPMDQYLVHHPEALLDKPIERFAFNPANPYVVEPHLACAAAEKPLTTEEIGDFSPAGLVRRGNGLYYPEPGLHPHQDVHLRGGGNQVTIVDAQDGRLLGTIDESRAKSELHPGAIYLHQGRPYVSEELVDDIALVSPTHADFSTMTLSETDIEILRTVEERRRPGISVQLNEVEVTEQVTGFIRRHRSGEILGQESLHLPPDVLTTRAVTYTIDPVLLEAVGLTPADWPGALHAAEHAAIGILPLIATCDRWDLGGLSTADHPDTMLPTVFVYDGYPGGAGFADCGFELFDDWITATYDTIDSCGCESGCPSCIISPKCGNANEPLSKEGALRLLSILRTQDEG